MALIGKAAGTGDLGQLESAFQQKLFRPFDAPFHQPATGGMPVVCRKAQAENFTR